METEMGPVAFEEQLHKVQGYIEVGQEEGAELVYGGKRPRTEELKDGYFIGPTIFAGVRNEMRVAREEIFGPCSRSYLSKTKRISSGRRTIRAMGWRQGYGPRMSREPIASRTP
jgi:acyl-CoA reductase-like NAD-dependent aldehyde dehydrogenase